MEDWEMQRRRSSGGHNPHSTIRNPQIPPPSGFRTRSASYLPTNGERDRRLAASYYTKEVIAVKRLLTPPSAETARAQDMIAMVLSIVPGLGHIYKGHFAAGFVWMFLGIPLALWIGFLLGLATGGVGLIFPLVCWAALAVDAYSEKDRRRHHWMTTNGTDEDFSASID